MRLKLRQTGDSIKKTTLQRRAVRSVEDELFFSVFLLELVDTAGRVHKHVLTRIEGVRHAGDLQLYQRIFLAVFPSADLLGGRSGTGDEGKTITHVLENNEPVCFRMDTFFHFALILKFAWIWPCYLKMGMQS